VRFILRIRGDNEDLVEEQPVENAVIEFDAAVIDAHLLQDPLNELFRRRQRHDLRQLDKLLRLQHRLQLPADVVDGRDALRASPVADTRTSQSGVSAGLKRPNSTTPPTSREISASTSLIFSKSMFI
jgi:hypothetical protein